MKKAMEEYEKFVRREIKDYNRSEEFLHYHEEMVRCFQHERLIHLIITLFFVALTLVFLGMTGFLIGGGKATWEAWPLYLATLLLTILSVAYVKYYHYLENHLQKLYKATGVISGFEKRF